MGKLSLGTGFTILLCGVLFAGCSGGGGGGGGAPAPSEPNTPSQSSGNASSSGDSAQPAEPQGGGVAATASAAPTGPPVRITSGAIKTVTLHPRWPVLRATGGQLEVEIRGLVTGSGPFEGDLYFETTVGAFAGGVGMGIRVPLVGSDPRVEVRGEGRYEVRVQLQVPANFVGRIDLDAWLSRYATRLRGRTYLVVRPGKDTCVLNHDGIAIPQSSTQSLSAVAGDIDADGDLDLVVGLDSTAADPSALRVLVNDGKGLFSDEALTRFVPGGGRRCAVVQLGDVDEDGDLDLLIGLKSPGVAAGGVASELWLNDGAGNFKYLSTRFSSLPVSVNAAILADMDEDGWLDIVVGAGRFQAQAGGGFTANGDEVRVYWNKGYGDFPVSHRVLRNCGSASLARGDMNGDGRVDLAVGGVETQGLVLLRGPHRCWEPVAHPGWGTSTGVALFDQDGDGDLDWLSLGGLGTSAAASLMEPRLLKNGGTGALSQDPSAFALLGDPAQGTTSLVADFNGDQRSDLFLCFDDVSGSTRDLRNRLLFGSTGAFDLVREGAATDRTSGGASGDFDGDGDIDLFVANRASPDFLLRNALIK